MIVVVSAKILIFTKKSKDFSHIGIVTDNQMRIFANRKITIIGIIQ